MKRPAAIGIVLASLLVPAVVGGMWTGRWGQSERLKQAVSRLEQVPEALGEDWDVQTRSLSAREVAAAELDGYVSRQYVNRRTGGVVSVLLLCGRPGPISAHTPEVCYAGAGFARTGQKDHAEGGANFRVIDFQKETAADPTRLRVFLTWGHGGEWAAPADPRGAFAGKSYLYKLYVVREMARANEPLEKDEAAELIQKLMPQLQEALFAGP